MAVGSHRRVLPSLPLGGGRLGRAQADAVRPEAQPAAPRLAGRAQAGSFVRQVSVDTTLNVWALRGKQKSHQVGLWKIKGPVLVTSPCGRASRCCTAHTQASCATRSDVVPPHILRRFLSRDEIVTASTDSSLRLWSIRAGGASAAAGGTSSGTGQQQVPSHGGADEAADGGLLSGAAVRTFSGHTNERNFVGLAVHGDYIACGSETNQVGGRLL